MDRKEAVSRREFLRLSAAGAAALAAGVVFGCGKSSTAGMPDEKVQDNNVVLSLDDPKYSALKDAGGAVKVPVEGEKRPVIVIRASGTEVLAFSSACSHHGCEMPLPAGGKTICPCHSAEFDDRGKTLKGPAKEDLKAFPAALAENTVVITVR